MSRPLHEYEAISFRDTPITDLDREGLLEALYCAYRNIKVLREERNFLQEQLEQLKSAKSRKE
jgi:hypothetical protein